jgi:hypothetical protein
MTAITGNCPMGCREGLILGEGGTIWCGSLLCPRPTAAAEILADPEAGHIVDITLDGQFTIRHPPHERLDDALLTCKLHQLLAGENTPFLKPGRYRASGEPDWVFTSAPS